MIGLDNAIYQLILRLSSTLILQYHAYAQLYKVYLIAMVFWCESLVHALVSVKDLNNGVSLTDMRISEIARYPNQD